MTSPSRERLIKELRLALVEQPRGRARLIHADELMATHRREGGDVFRDCHEISALVEIAFLFEVQVHTCPLVRQLAQTVGGDLIPMARHQTKS